MNPITRIALITAAIVTLPGRGLHELIHYCAAIPFTSEPPRLVLNAFEPGGDYVALSLPPGTPRIASALYIAPFLIGLLLTIAALISLPKNGVTGLEIWALSNLVIVTHISRADWKGFKQVLVLTQ